MEHILVLILLALAAERASSFATRSFVLSSIPIRTELALAYVDPSEEPFFQMQQIPTATTGARLDHVVECAENGECDLEEMMAMVQELERLNDECTGSMSRECNLDAVAARNVLKVALASKIMVEEVMTGEHESESHKTEECDFNPFSVLHEMDDECLDDMHGIPTDAMMESSLDRIVQCAEDGECDIGEMADMIEELERLNLDCEGTISRECSLDAREARNILKVALGSRAAMAREAKSRDFFAGDEDVTP